LSRPIYPELLDHDSTHGRPCVLALSHTAYFVTHSAPEAVKGDLRSPENPHEVDIILSLASFLIGLGYKPERITVLSAYVGQLLLIRAGLTACGMDKVVLSTVDAYQGEENDLVLLSLVRSNAEGKLGFTSVDNRICVALSRARLGFFCACNLAMLSAGSELWRQVLSLYKICVHFQAVVHESIILLFPPTTCIAHTTAILLHGYCAINDSSLTPL